MIQNNDGNRGQTTQNGDIINCHGGTTCPFRDTPESQRQAEFVRATGIWCPPKARDVLESLMRDHSFTARELAMAWKADSLGWDTKTGEISIRTPWIEAVGGWLMAAFMIVYYLLLVGPLWLKDQRDLRSMAAFLLASAIYLGAAWLIGRFILRPRRIAFRVRRVLGR